MSTGQESTYVDGSGYLICPECGNVIFDKAEARLVGGKLFHSDCVDPGQNATMGEFS